MEAMGETLYHIFMSDPDSLYLNIDTVQADILVSNKVDIPKSERNWMFYFQVLLNQRSKFSKI